MDIGASKNGRRATAGLIPIDKAREKQGILSEPDGTSGEVGGLRQEQAWLMPRS